MKEQYIEALRDSPLFRGFTADGARFLLDRGELKEHEPGELLIAEGDPSSFVMVVLTGQLQVFVERQGHEMTLSEPGPGLTVGELGVLCGIPRTASVRAIKRSAVLRWSDAAFRSMLLGDVRLSQRIFNQLLQTLIDKERSLIDALVRSQGGSR